MKPGLADMKNAIVVPHIASASKVIFSTDLYFAGVNQMIFYFLNFSPWFLTEQFFF